MRTLFVLATVTMFTLGAAVMASACPNSQKTADQSGSGCAVMKQASAGCAAKSAGTAGASCASRTVQTAGASCASQAVQTAGACSAAKTAGQCSAKAMKTAALENLEVRTTRMPSGALLVFYTSTDPETVKTLQASAASGADGFDCRLCKRIAAGKECTIETAFVEDGVVALVTSEDAATVDAYARQYAALNTENTSSSQ